MARKKNTEKAMQTEETNLRAVRLELTEKVHALLRIEAAKEDLSLAAMARRLVERGLGVKEQPK